MESKTTTKQQLIITKGLPGSGKTTWAKAWVAEDPKNRVRVCRDDIRRMLGPYWVPSRESLVTRIEFETIISALLITNSDIVIDATGFKYNIDHWIQELTYDEDHPYHTNLTEDVEFRTKDFTDVPLEECIKNDLKRSGDARVDCDTIKKFYYKYLYKGPQL